MTTEIQLPDLKEVEFELTTEDVNIIQGYVKEIKSPNCYVEIGTKYGGSALVARHAAKKGVPIYSIDPCADLKMWKEDPEKFNIHFINQSLICSDI